MEPVAELDVGLGVHQVEEPHRPRELLVEPGRRALHRPEVEDDEVEVVVVKGLVRLDRVLTEDEPERDVTETGAPCSRPPGSGRRQGPPRASRAGCRRAARLGAK